MDHSQYLLRLAELELIDRHQRMLERRIRAARFPAVKTLDTFDFPATPSCRWRLVRIYPKRVMRLGYVLSALAATRK